MIILRDLISLLKDQEIEVCIFEKGIETTRGVFGIGKEKEVEKTYKVFNKLPASQLLKGGKVELLDREVENFIPTKTFPICINVVLKPNVKNN